MGIRLQHLLSPSLHRVVESLVEHLGFMALRCTQHQLRYNWCRLGVRSSCQSSTPQKLKVPAQTCNSCQAVESCAQSETISNQRSKCNLPPAWPRGHHHQKVSHQNQHLDLLSRLLIYKERDPLTNAKSLQLAVQTCPQILQMGKLCTAILDKIGSLCLATVPGPGRT